MTVYWALLAVWAYWLMYVAVLKAFDPQPDKTEPFMGIIEFPSTLTESEMEAFKAAWLEDQADKTALPSEVKAKVRG